METLKRFKVVAGTHYGTPKEYGASEPKLDAAGPHFSREFLKANEALLGLEDIHLRRKRVIESVGARHIILRQYLGGLPIHRGYVTVHMADNGSTYLVKNRSVPREFAQPAADFKIDAQAADRRAGESVTKNPAMAHILATEKIWFPLGSKLRPAYRVIVRRVAPREDWIIFVDGESGRILRKYDNLAGATAVAKVFDPNPVAALGSDD
jgi:Zn-dependent metalloprotease